MVHNRTSSLLTFDEWLALHTYATGVGEHFGVVDFLKAFSFGCLLGFVSLIICYISEDCAYCCHRLFNSSFYRSRLSGASRVRLHCNGVGVSTHDNYPTVIRVAPPLTNENASTEPSRLSPPGYASVTSSGHCINSEEEPEELDGYAETSL